MQSARVPAWVWVVAVLVLLGLPVAYKPRGIRNRNLLNLRPLSGSNTWLGQVGLDTAKGGPFVVFGEKDGKPGEFWGIRAGAKLLLNYQRNNGLFTVAGMINRFAPPSENDTGLYVRTVAKAMGVGVDQPVDLANNPALLQAMVKAMIKHEQGTQPASDQLVAQAVSAARA